MVRSLIICVLALATTVAHGALLPASEARDRIPSTPARAAAAILPRASPGCATTYSCPAKDRNNFALGVGQHRDSNCLFCSYPSKSGDNADRYYCNYDRSSGTLTQDHDEGLCPQTAAGTTSCARNVLPADSIVRAFNEESERRRIKPRSEVPGYMNIRSKLADRKAKKGEGRKA